MNTDALRFSATQGKTCVADLNKNRIGAKRTASNDANRLSLDKTEFTKAFCDGIVAIETADRIDDGRRKGRKFGKIHNV